jgi:hypothetical protein
MKPVSIVTIEELLPIYKDGVPANAIEVAKIKDAEGVYIQYDVVVGKGLHQIGGKGVYIQPDYTIPMNRLFVEYHAPQGDPKKSKLGKKGRIRAIKFNLNFEGSTDPIYSYGILLPWADFFDFYRTSIEPNIVLSAEEKTAKFDDIKIPNVSTDGTFVGFSFDSPDFPFQEILGVEKYVADDNLDGSQPAGMIKRDFPSFMYKTDEETIQNHRKEIDRAYRDGEELSFTQKRDGSSLTEYFRINPISDPNQVDVKTEEFGICSRKHEKKLDQQYVAAYKDGDIILHPYFHPELKIKGWFNDDTRAFYTAEEAAEKFESVIEEQRDAWTDTDKKFGYLEKLMNYCRANGLQLVIRGELIGAGNKGSGNKLNSDARTESHVIWFGVDDLSSGVARRNHYGTEYNLIKVCTDLGFEYTQELFSGVFSYDEIIAKAHEYFAKVKAETGIIVEGVVIRTKFSNHVSVKYVNPEYDAKS